MKKEKVYHAVMDIAKKVARERQDGGLFVIAPKRKLTGTYKTLYPQLLSGHHVNEKGMDTVFLALSKLDGAFLISEEGELLAYGAMIRKVKPMPGFGTKHAAAAGMTSYCKESTAILVTEKIDWLKIFKGGRVIMEMDSADRPENIKDKIISFITDQDTALITAAGASAAIIGFPAVFIISGTYLAVKTASGIIKKNLESIK